jgi:hypothetical protein
MGAKAHQRQEIMEKFDGHDYTERSVLEELLLIERHSRDGSAIQAGCACIEEKHLLTLAGLSSEMPTLAKSQDEANFYMDLARLAREKREEILDANFKDPPADPKPRKYLPHGLTEEEKEDSALRKKLSSCISQAEISCCGTHTSDYSGCSCNPAAVCRASIEK